MLYTNRRADADDEKGVKWVHGTDIGIASTPERRIDLDRTRFSRLYLELHH